jgi:hypothetical protein
MSSMSSHHRSHLTVAALALLLGATGAACAGSNGESKAPESEMASTEPPQGGRSASASPAPNPAATAGHGLAAQAGVAAPQPASSATAGAAPAPASSGTAAAPGAAGSEDEKDDAELVVNREVVGRCPKLRLVRQHVAEFDPEMVWLAVLESLGECMAEGGPMADQFIGVSGDEEHRHVVREVLGSRGVAPTRVVATPPSQGAAECQGGVDCSKRVEITIAPGP